MTEQHASSGPLLGFFILEKTASEDGFIAALMVIDDRGYPLEFRATTPIRPSLVQRTLYGKQLEHYVGIELCGAALLRELKRKPGTILVPDRRLLDIADKAGVNVAAIWRAGEALRPESEDSEVTHGTIKAPGSPFPPLEYEGRFRNSDSEGDAIARLKDCAGRFDLIEVFERMRAALQLLAKEDPRYA